MPTFGNGQNNSKTVCICIRIFYISSTWDYTTFHSFFNAKQMFFKSPQVCDWLDKWKIMLGFMDLRRLRVVRRSNIGLVPSVPLMALHCFVCMWNDGHILRKSYVFIILNLTIWPKLYEFINLWWAVELCIITTVILRHVICWLTNKNYTLKKNIQYIDIRGSQHCVCQGGALADAKQNTGI